MPRPTSLLALALLVLAMAGCSAAQDGASAANVAERKVRVTATTNFITDTLREIGGDRVEVTGLMGAGVDPHLYKASAGDVGKLRDADLIVYGGLNLEGKMADLLDELAERQTTVAITKDIARDRLLAPPQGTAFEYDPHVWFDVGLWQIAARTAAETLKAKDPTHAAVYDANLARYRERLSEVDADVRAQIATIPRARRVLVTSHDAFAYFGRRYDVDVVAIQGISTATEATTASIRRVAQIIAARNVKAAFIESSVPRQTIDAVLAAARRRGADVRVGGSLFSDAAGDPDTPAGTYIGMLRANAETITNGLR
ncbi:MAG TPA: zinc ABC transporter substrate-binding protein [Solirubrobacteraceae bacterium]|nr:zinc ABC transporter substrate-binding protein [Solirubrobacteraceae bacterium]